MIYLVRHGEAAESWGAHPDPGLSETGRTQADTAAEALNVFEVKHAISSPMQRCQETSAPFISKSGLILTINPAVTEIPTPPEITDRVSWLRDLMLGSWETVPDSVQNWRNTLIQTVSNLPDETVVFSHFIAINAIVGQFENRSNVTVFRPDHCSITRLEITPSGLALVARGQEAGTKIL